MNDVKYMGHFICENRLKPDPDKVSAIYNMPRPENCKEGQRFLGFVTYLRKFLPCLSEIADPLRRLTEKDCIFMWQNSQKEAFNKLKEFISATRE